MINLRRYPKRFSNDMPLLDRLMDSFLCMSNGCWEWQRTRGKLGYGAFGYKGKSTGAHRFMYEIFYGEIPRGLVIDHLCNNPHHLRACTQRENVLRSRGTPAINIRKTKCPKGHEYTKTTKRGWRVCQTCRTADQKVKRALQRELILA